jgi:selenide,water dikinase
LSQVVRRLAGFFPATEYPEVLVGLGEPDDAAVFRLDDERALIKTTDFFTPIVDDPWTYGAIAAANAMSDVYAMGGEVLFCLNIAGFPEALPVEVIAEIFNGGAAKVREAGAAIAGGHSINSPEPFYGLSVTGLIHPERVMRKGGARPGDRLFLTKPLGTGIITTAAKRTGPGESDADRTARRAQNKPDLEIAHLDAAIASMTRLNRAAARAAQAAEVQGATDITGFGLLGHAVEMAAASGRTAGSSLRIRASEVPALPGVWDYIAAGYLTSGSRRSPAAFGEQVTFAPNITPAQRTLLWEAETSGGLLIAVPAAQVEILLAACAAEQPVWEIGEVLRGQGVEVV